MAGSSANLGALNSEWTDLANKVSGAFYYPGSKSQVAARRAQNGQDGSVAEQPTAPPVVVGQAPKLGTQPTDRIDKLIANTPIDPAPAVPANKYDDVVAAAVAKGARNSFSDTGLNGSVNIGATPIAAPVAAPAALAVKPPVMNNTLVEQQQNLMAQIAAAQSVVQAGSNRDGYKMGDVTKGLATMQALSPLVNSTNNLIANTYGTDAGILTHSMDNTTRTSIADAGNATEMAKTNLAGQYGIEGRKIDAEGNIALAQQKAVIDANSPQSQKALVDAQTGLFKLNNAKTGNYGANLALEGKYDVQQVKDVAGVTRGRMVNGVYVPFSDGELAQVTPPQKKK